MNKQVELILKEIESIYEHVKNSERGNSGAFYYMKDLIDFINSLPEEPSSPIDFEQELYNAFGQVKDFTLGMRIAKYFYNMGRDSQEPSNVWRDAKEKPERENLLIETNDGRVIHRDFINNHGMVKRWMYLDDLLNQQQEPVSEDLSDYINELSKQFPEVSFAKLSRIAVRVAKWKEQQMTGKAINSVWHDAREEPRFDKQILAVHPSGYAMADYKGRVLRSFLKRWAYIDDLLPKSE